jgi:anti-anti-sigma factor
MPLSVIQQGSVTVAAVGDSKLTYPVLGPFFQALRAVVEDGARQLVVDFSAVTFIDSPTIGCVIDLHRLAQDHGGALKLAGFQPRIETLFAMTGVLRILDVHATVEQAVEAFGQITEAPTPEDPTQGPDHRSV